MNTLQLSPQVVPQQIAGFWPQLLRDESMHALTNLERLVTGCEIIAALDDLEILGELSC
ncbi:MAG: hypothetical protein M3Y86_05215 [Verrucomicrobiota bacterium]|nr:hypothetical protein [Verrucomicrobiota bacterium]